MCVFTRVAVLSLVGLILTVGCTRHYQPKLVPLDMPTAAVVSPQPTVVLLTKDFRHYVQAQSFHNFDYSYELGQALVPELKHILTQAFPNISFREIEGGPIAIAAGLREQQESGLTLLVPRFVNTRLSQPGAYLHLAVGIELTVVSNDLSSSRLFSGQGESSKFLIVGSPDEEVGTEALTHALRDLVEDFTRSRTLTNSK